MGVDRILDMSRTAINVTGDLVACRMMETWVGGQGNVELLIEEESLRTSDVDMQVIDNR